MLQRLKGVIDARIADEQSRQRTGVGPSKSASGTSTPSQSRAGGRQRGVSASGSGNGSVTSNGSAVGREQLSLDGDLDPSVFEPDFVVGDDESLSRADTPQPVGLDASAGSLNGATPADVGASPPAPAPPLPPPKESGASEGRERSRDARPQAGGGRASPSPMDLPVDVRLRLKRLERLEPKYSELLRSYRLAHARNKAIGPFEASLRENTPVASIADPAAFIEYLTQITNKTGLVMDELRRMTEEKDRLKQELAQARKDTAAAAEELSRLRDVSAVDVTRKDSVNVPDNEPQPGEHAETEDFFSYNSEIPRLSSELHVKEDQLHRLQHDNTTLRENLSSAENLSSRLREELGELNGNLNGIRESKALVESEMNQKYQELQVTADGLRSQLKALELKEQSAVEDSDKTEPGVTTVPQTDTPNAMQDTLRESRAEMEDLQKNQSLLQKRNDTLQSLLATVRAQLTEAESEKKRLLSEANTDNANLSQQTASREEEKKPTASKKKRKGKDKSPAISSTPSHTGVENGTVDATKRTGDLEAEKGLSELLEQARQELRDKDAAIEGFQRALKDQNDLREEIEGLKDDLILVGQSHVEAKEKMTKLEDEKAALLEEVRSLEEKLLDTGTRRAEQDATDTESRALELKDLRSRATTLEIDLNAAQNLASSRFKEITQLRAYVQKVQPELTSLRSEASELKTMKSESQATKSQIHKLESAETDLRASIATHKKQMAQKELEIRSLTEKISEATRNRSALEEANRRAIVDLERSEKDRHSAVEAKTALAKELSQAKKDAREGKSKLESLQEEAAKLAREAARVKEGVELKSAQQASAESMMNSMQGQVHEMSVQMKEFRERSDNLEEELSDAHRLLSERSREGETMRRLLADVEARAQSRVKEMRERLELAVEERDRAEEEASTIGRRRTRELEDLRNRIRDAERSLAKAVDERDEALRVEERLKRQREEAEASLERASKEATEGREAIQQLRAAISELESKAQDHELERSQLKQTLEEHQLRLQKVQRASKSMAEDAKGSAAAKSRPADHNVRSSRSSIESLPSRSFRASPAPRPSNASPSPSFDGSASGNVDHVYLKNVLLQFLEQKDKKYQMQLMPVLGMLLQFDKKDEQRWLAVISAK